jgi:hypothetical protein
VDDSTTSTNDETRIAGEKLSGIGMALALAIGFDQNISAAMKRGRSQSSPPSRPA